MSPKLEPILQVVVNSQGVLQNLFLIRISNKPI